MCQRITGIVVTYLVLCLCYVATDAFLSNDEHPVNEPLDCSPCPVGTGVVTSCSTATDTVCSTCASGYYNNIESTDAVCATCSMCGNGFFELAPCVESQDTVCQSCSIPMQHLNAQIQCSNGIQTSPTMSTMDKLFWNENNDAGVEDFSGDIPRIEHIDDVRLTPSHVTSEEDGSGELSVEYMPTSTIMSKLTKARETTVEYSSSTKVHQTTVEYDRSTKVHQITVGYSRSTKVHQTTVGYYEQTTTGADEILGEFTPVRDAGVVVEAQPLEPEVHATAGQEEQTTEAVVGIDQSSGKVSKPFQWPILFGIIGAGLLIYIVLIAAMCIRSKRRKGKHGFTHEVPLDYEDPFVRTTMIDKTSAPLTNSVNKEQRTPIYNGAKHSPQTAKYQPLLTNTPQTARYQPLSSNGKNGFSPVAVLTPSKKKRSFGQSKEFQFMDDESDDDVTSSGQAPSSYNDDYKQTNPQNLQTTLHDRFQALPGDKPTASNDSTFERLPNGRSVNENEKSA